MNASSTTRLGALARCVVALALAAGAAQAQAPGDLRIALVIGNAAYVAAPLANPVNDARAVGAALKQMGFTVIEARDVGRVQMQAAIAGVRDALKDRNGVGLLYYAGHGMQLDWHNYMVPVDARMSEAADVARQAVDVQDVLEAFKAAGNRMNIVVLDACRDNPFRVAGAGKGLAQMDAPPSTLLAYATAPGNVAEDGTEASGNGLYTQFLVQELKQPAARIEDVFKRVRFQVRQKSEGRQIPWESTSLEDDFYFDSGIKPFVRLAGKARDQAFNQEKADWDRIASSKRAEDFYAFLQKYPNGNIANLAQSKLDQVQAAKIVAQPDRSGMAAEDSSQRFRDGDRYEFVFKEGLTGLVQGTATGVVRAVGDDSVEVSGPGLPTGRATHAGFILQDAGGSYDPPYMTLPGGEYQVGRKWSGRTIQTRADGSRQWVDVDSEIVGREKVTVPLGTFDVYRIEVSMIYQNGGRAKVTFWSEPGWGMALKMTRVSKDINGRPDVKIREMTARSRVGG